jgi:predicted nucleic acid-binding protein
VSVFVVDASVVLKWFFPEPDSAAARRLLDVGHQYVAPDLLFAEVGNAVWKRVRRGELSSEEGQQLIADLAEVTVETLATRGLVSDACAIAMASRQTVYDSLYLALAVRLDTQLVTADRRLENGARTNPALAEHICMVDAFSRTDPR